MYKISLILFFLLMAITPAHAQYRIIFLGDSITEAGASPGGYVTLVADSLRKIYADITVLGAGISGNKVPDLLTRVDEDVLAYSPTHVVVYIGINDVWHQFEFDSVAGTEPKTFSDGLQELVDRIEKTEAVVLLCTPSVIGEDTESDAEINLRLEEYAELVRDVAQERDVYLCDLRSSMEAYLTEHNLNRDHSGILTSDGVHLNAEGNRFVAEFMISELRSVLGF